MRFLSLALTALFMTACGGGGESTSSTADVNSVSSVEKSLALSSAQSSKANSSTEAQSSTQVNSSSSIATSTSKSSVATVSSNSSSNPSSKSSSSLSSKVNSSSSKSSVSPVWIPGANDKGFTVIKPSDDSLLIYVSSSGGSDTNDCLSVAKPCKTIAAAYSKMRAGYPDHVYLKRGDVWRDEVLTGIKSGRSAQEPAVLSYYGDSGARPKVERSSSFINTGAANGRHLISNVHFIGLEFSAYKLVYGSAEFTGSHDDSASFVLLGSNKNILIEDCVFNHAELVIQDFTTSNTTERHPVNIILRRNIWTGAYADASSLNQTYRPSNLYASSVEGLLIEENVFDYGGWHPNVMDASANMYNHNLYLQTSNVGNLVTVRNNIITRASSHGIHGRAGGLFENNFFARNAISLQMGYANKMKTDENGNKILVTDNALKAGTFARAINNVITEGNSMVKGTNPCVGAGLCSSALWGLRTENPGEGTFTVNNNIVHSRSPVDNQWSVKYNGLSAESITAYGLEHGSGNIMWKWKDSTEGTNQNYPDPGRTLEDYSSHLGHPHDFDAFMEILLNRPPQTWDEKYTADAINDYIRAGFDMK